MNRAAEAITGYRRRSCRRSTRGAPRCMAARRRHGGSSTRRWTVRSGGLPRRCPWSSPARTARPATSSSPRRLDDRPEFWMLIDMTEQDEAELALHRSEDYLRSIVNTAADAIITIDQARRHRHVQPGGGTDVRLRGSRGRRTEHSPADAAALSRRTRRLMSRYRETGEASASSASAAKYSGSERRDDDSARSHGQSDRPPRRFTGILRDLRNAGNWSGAWPKARPRSAATWPAELHDEIGGHMTGIGLLAQSLQAGLTQAESPLAAKTQELVAQHRRGAPASAIGRPRPGAGRGDPRRADGRNGQPGQSLRNRVGHSLPIPVRASRARR